MPPNNPPVSRYTLHRLRRRYHYDPDNGIFRNGSATGKIAGVVSSFGYLKIKFDSREIMAHRLAWLYVNGRWPTDQIDHMDGDKLNNRMANLRDVVQTLNMQNQRVAHKGSATGLLGTYWHKRQNTFYAQIRVDKKLLTLGYFTLAEDAHEAYLSAKRKLHPGSMLTMDMT